ncbi:MAG: hypothetical protein WEC34_02165 [Acidimicrobiia bacterium]
MIDDLLGYIEGESEQWRADDDDATAISRPVGQPPRYDGAHWIDETSVWATFRADLRTAIRAWKVAPALPIVTMMLVAVQRALGIVSRDIDWVFLAIAAISLATIGFPGAQRVWYLRAFRGDVLDAAEVWPITRAFFGRFFVLGLATLVVTARPQRLVTKGRQVPARRARRVPRLARIRWHAAQSTSRGGSATTSPLRPHSDTWSHVGIDHPGYQRLHQRRSGVRWYA